MRTRLMAAFPFAFALGISLVFAPVETSARMGGLGGRPGVRAGAAIPHPFNPHLARPFGPRFGPFNRHFSRFSRSRDNSGGVGGYGDYYGNYDDYYPPYYGPWPSYYPPYPSRAYPPSGAAPSPMKDYALTYRRGCDSETVKVPSERGGGYRSVNIVRC